MFSKTGRHIPSSLSGLYTQDCCCHCVLAKTAANGSTLVNYFITIQASKVQIYKQTASLLYKQTASLVYAFLSAFYIYACTVFAYATQLRFFAAFTKEKTL